MRTTYWIGACLGLLAVTLDVRAQSPGTAWGSTGVLLPEVYAWSGPNQEKNYQTNLLRQNTTVVVKCDQNNRPIVIDDINPKHPGWVEIKPPQGSCSWIHQRFIKQVPGSKNAWVVTANRPVGIFVASQVVADEPKVEKVQLPKDTQVIVVAQPVPDRQGGYYYPIQSPDNEPRYIPANAIKLTAVTRLEQTTSRPGSGVAQVSNNVPANSNTAPAKNTAPTNNWSVTAGGSNRTVAGTTALYTRNDTAVRQLVPGQRQWSEWGTLEKTTLPPIDGQEVFRLKVNGQPYAYATAQPGYTLSNYVGQYLTLYGLVSASPDDSIRVMRISVQHVSLNKR
jgi:hypothetical protein